MTIFNPEVDGTVSFRSATPDFLEAFRQRVKNGLLTGQPNPRSNYLIGETGPSHVVVRAGDFWTAFNVGLNSLELQIQEQGLVRYRVRYWRWARYSLALGGALGLMGIVLLLTFDVRTYIAEHPASMLPGLSLDQNLLFAWFMVFFWGVVCPWLLIPMHKRPVRRLVERLIAEVDG